MVEVPLKCGSSEIERKAEPKKKAEVKKKAVPRVFQIWEEPTLAEWRPGNPNFLINFPFLYSSGVYRKKVMLLCF